MPLAVDYRPRNFEEFLGNSATITSLKSVLKREDTPHAFLFYGPRGCGKTTLARLVKNTLKCSDMDFREIDAGSDGGKNTILRIKEDVRLRPLGGKTKFFLIDEAHGITGAAANAFLITLEEPPPYVFFALCTTNPEKILITVRDRCAQFPVKPLINKDMNKLIDWVLKEEGTSLEKEVISEIMSRAEGIPRRALWLLDQIIDLTDSKTQIASLDVITSEDKEIIDLCRALADSNSSGFTKWKKVRDVLKGTNDKQPEDIRRAVLGYLSQILMKSTSPESFAQTLSIAQNFEGNFFDSGRSGLILACAKSILE